MGKPQPVYPFARAFIKYSLGLTKDLLRPSKEGVNHESV